MNRQNDPLSPVAVSACDSYETPVVQDALKHTLELIDGLSFVKPGMTVAIKVNLIAGRSPDRAATTNPVVVTELCRMLIDRSARVIVGDSPGGTFTENHLRSAYRASGLTAVEEVGAALNYDCSERNASFPEAAAIKTFSYTGWLNQADAIINCCKLKTHAMLTMTCAVKNLFGTIPGTTKPEYHLRFPDLMDFANMMVDLNEFFCPQLHLVDAVDCMEGNGPTAGTPRHMGALLACRTPYPLDLVCSHLIGLKPADVATISAAAARGLCPDTLAEIPLVGDAIDAFVIPDFQTDIKRIGVNFALGSGLLGKISGSITTSVFRTRPQVRAAECIGCAKCAEVCPANAISMRDRRPEIDRAKCIRCFCCQEFCPEGAMKVHHTLPGRIIRAIGGGKRK